MLKSSLTISYTILWKYVAPISGSIILSLYPGGRKYDIHRSATSFREKIRSSMGTFYAHSRMSSVENFPAKKRFLYIIENMKVGEK